MKSTTTPDRAVGSSDSSASDLIDALDMMRDEFLRIIACPGCNAEIEDLANRAQLKLIQRVPVIVQRDRAEDEACRLRVRLREIEEYVSGWRQRLDKTGPDITADGGGYIPEAVIEELEQLLSSLPNKADMPTCSK
jgi:hypothetical protein